MSLGGAVRGLDWGWPSSTTSWTAFNFIELPTTVVYHDGVIRGTLTGEQTEQQLIYGLSRLL